MEELMTQIMYEIPSDLSIQKVIVTESCVQGGQPQISGMQITPGQRAGFGPRLNRWNWPYTERKPTDAGRGQGNCLLCAVFCRGSVLISTGAVPGGCAERRRYYE